MEVWVFLLFVICVDCSLILYVSCVTVPQCICKCLLGVNKVDIDWLIGQIQTANHSACLLWLYFNINQQLMYVTCITKCIMCSYLGIWLFFNKWCDFIKFSTDNCSYFRRSGCIVALSSFTESSCQGAVYGRCDTVPGDEPRVQCRTGRQARARSWPPDTQEAYSRILMIAGQESLWQRKLSQATSCDRLARISFMVWKGRQIWKPQHYEAAHEKAFLSILPLLFSYPGWDERENTLSVVHDLMLRRASQA